MIDHNPPALDRLNAARLAYRVGATAAERCQELLPTVYSGAELERLTAAYTRRAADFRACLAIVEAQIAALPTVDIYPEAARARFRPLVLARRAGLITAREFGLAAWWVRR